MKNESCKHKYVHNVGYVQDRVGHTPACTVTHMSRHTHTHTQVTFKVFASTVGHDGLKNWMSPRCGTNSYLDERDSA